MRDVRAYELGNGKWAVEVLSEAPEAGAMAGGSVPVPGEFDSKGAAEKAGRKYRDEELTGPRAD